MMMAAIITTTTMATTTTTGFMISAPSFDIGTSDNSLFLPLFNNSTDSDCGNSYNCDNNYYRIHTIYTFLFQ